MDVYLLTIYATLEQEEAIRELFHRMNWDFKKKEDDGGIRGRITDTDIYAVPYKFISSNVPVGNVYIKRTSIAQLPSCECNPSAENPCSFESSCYNRLMWYECNSATCPSGKKCQNQNFQKKEYPPQEPFQTVNRGLGLRTLVDIKRGQFVNEYVGEIIDNELCLERISQAQQNKCTNFYMLALDKYRVIDARFKGNLSRFINHSCDPNLVTQKWHVNGEDRIGLFALKDIQAGSELTFNYNFDCLGNEKIPCKCRAVDCSGYLGDQPKPLRVSTAKKQSSAPFAAGQNASMQKNTVSYDEEEEGQEEAIDLSSSGKSQQTQPTDPWEVPEILVNITKSALKTLSNLRSNNNKTPAQTVGERVHEREVTQSAENQNEEKNDISLMGSSQNADPSADERCQKTIVHVTRSFEKTFVVTRERERDTTSVTEIESPETTGVLLTEPSQVNSTPVPGSSKLSDSSLATDSPMKPGKSPQQVSALESEILQWFAKLHTPTLEAASQVGISEELSNLIESHRSQAKSTPEALLEKFKTLANTTGNVLVQSHPFQPVVQFTALSTEEDAHPYDTPESCIGAMETCGETQPDETDLYKGIAPSYFSDSSSDSSNNSKSASLNEENQENIPQPLSPTVKVKFTKTKAVKGKASNQINRKRKTSTPIKCSPARKITRKSLDKSVSSPKHSVPLSRKQITTGGDEKGKKRKIQLAVRKVPKISSSKLMASRKSKMEAGKKLKTNILSSDKDSKENTSSETLVQALMNYSQSENKVTTTRYREGDYACSLCGLRFKTEKRYQKHKQLDKCLYECPYCYKVYNVSNYTNYKAHLRVHENNKPFKCDQCPKAFNWEADLKNHKIIHTGLRPYVCKVCLKCFTNPHYMKTHILNMHTGRPKAYLCDICGTGFKLKGNLLDHVRTVHATFRAFPCKQCGKAFKSKSHLIKHVSRHQPVTFPCGQCNKVFVEEKFLEKHKKKHKKAN
ncbi:hypothetical protein ACJMK2_006804 [Sinanodonta woodiana]|uniref:Uncharacterized protein n=1 Tax=Sinanodonta woodiana TaxID=1069815 RepID=A0ABD3VVY4_SINWO